MRKLFALLMALTMTVQLAMPAWADTVQEEPEAPTAAAEETEETEEPTEAVEEVPAEPEETEETEPTEAETAEATEETEEAAQTEDPPAEALPADEEEGFLEETEQLEAGPASGTWGDNLTWELDEDGVLTISGSGPMKYVYSSSAYPWYPYASQIASVVISDGVTTIEDYAFDSYKKLGSVTIPGSVTDIGNGAFDDCVCLTYITFGHRADAKLTIHDRAFGFSGNDSAWPIFTVVGVPSARAINPAIANYNWEKGYYSSDYITRTVQFRSTADIPMEAISLSTADGAVSYELGVPVKPVVTVDPVEATEEYRLYVVEDRTTARVFLSKDSILTTLSTGTVTLRAECADRPEIYSELTLTVTDPTGSLTNLTVTTLNDYPGDAELGTPVQMAAVFTPANAADRNVTWSIQNGTGKADIDANGLLTPQAVGTVTVYATAANGVEGSCTVNIVRYAEEITILLDGKPDVQSLGVGEGRELSVRFLPEDATTKGVEWSLINGTGTARLYSRENYSYYRLVGQHTGTVTLVATAKDSKKTVAKQEILITDTVRSYELPDGSGNLYYNTETGYITGADKTVKDVVIPSQIDGVAIVGIAAYVFANRDDSWGSLSENKTLKSVSIPATVEEIGERAFYYCTAMSSLRFAQNGNLKTIGASAFEGCKGVATLNIPEGVENFGERHS